MTTILHLSHQIRILILTGILFLSHSVVSQEVIKPEISSSEYLDNPGNVRKYFDFEDHITIFKVNPDKAFVHMFDKASKNLTEKIAVLRNDVIWIDGYERDNLLYCFYSKRKKQGAEEVYIDIIDLNTCTFIEEQKLLFVTPLQVPGLYPNNLLKIFDTSISGNKEFVTFRYYSLYTQQSICAVFSFQDQKIVNEIILKNTLEEPIVLLENKAGNNGEFVYLARTLTSKTKILGIIPNNNQEEIINISLSGYLNNIDTLQFYKNDLNGTILIGGTYYENESRKKLGIFAMELDYSGKLIREYHFLPEESDAEGYKKFHLPKTLCISFEKDNSLRVTTLNFETHEITHYIVNSENDVLRIIKNQLYPIADLGDFFPSPPTRMIESESFQDLFYYSINPATRKKSIYLNRYSKVDSSSKDYLIIENEKLFDVKLEKMILSEITFVNKHIYYFEVFLGKKKDVLMNINLK